MRILNVAVAALIVSACASTLIPRDVEDFISRRDVCDHLRGEFDGVDTEAQQEVITQTNKACAGTDAELARLKRQYADSPEVTKKLNSYEAHIEPD